jgi:serine/threonine protein kinase
MGSSEHPDTYRMGDPIPGTNYQFVRLLGQGGQGVVYEVREQTLKVHYAMKLLTSGLAASGRGIEELRKEAQMLAQHRSPHLVRVFGAGVTQEPLPRPFFVMDLLEGGSLFEILRSSSGRRLPMRTAINLAIQVLEGLDAAHNHRSCSIIHRDIKPSNIWVHVISPMESTAVILDLGIAKVLDEANLAQGDSGKAFMGTYDYAAPEQYNGGAVVQSDLYSLGCTLFEMVTGRRVFEGADSRAVVRGHLTEQAPRMSKYIAVPEELDNYLATVLEKDIRKRPRSAFEFSRGLRAIREILEIREKQRLAAHKTDDMALVDMYDQAQQRKERIDALMETVTSGGTAGAEFAAGLSQQIAREVSEALPQTESLGPKEVRVPEPTRRGGIDRNAPTRTARGAREALQVSMVSPYAETGGNVRADTASLAPGKAARKFAGTLPLDASPRPPDPRTAYRAPARSIAVVHKTEVLPLEGIGQRVNQFLRSKLRLPGLSADRAMSVGAYGVLAVGVVVFSALPAMPSATPAPPQVASIAAPALPTGVASGTPSAPTARVKPSASAAIKTVKPTVTIVPKPENAPIFPILREYLDE